MITGMHENLNIPDETVQAERAALEQQVQKEKATSRENLKKVMAITKEKKELEKQVQAYAVSMQQLQAQLQTQAQEESGAAVTANRKPTSSPPTSSFSCTQPSRRRARCAS